MVKHTASHAAKPLLKLVLPWLGLIAFLLGAPHDTKASQTEKVMVLKASNELYAAGQLLLVANEIKIDSDDFLVVMMSSGTTVQFGGGTQGKLIDLLPKEASTLSIEEKAEEVALFMDVASTLTQETEIAVRQRSVPGEKLPVSAWQIDTADRRDQCVRHQDRPTLWRRKAETQQEMRIQNSEVADETFVTFESGDNEIRWPVDMQITDGGRYVFAENALNRTRVALHVLPERLPTRVHIMRAMRGKSCDRQLRALLLHAEIDVFIGQKKKSNDM